VTPRDKLAAGRVRTFDYAPYLASYVYALKQRECRGTGTCGVSEDGVLHWDPAFVESLDADSMAYVILHEALHLIFRHHVRAKEVYGESPDPQLQLAMNIAGDLAIEQTLAFMRPLRPPGAIHLGADCPQLGITLDFPPNLDMLQYYGLITAKLRKSRRKRPGDGEGEQDGEGGEGTGGGSRVSDKQPQKSGGKKGSSTKPNGRAAACRPGSGGSAGDGVRRPYEQPDESWGAYQESLSAASLESAIAKHESLHPGSVPGKLKESIAQLLRPQPDPFEHLRSAVASSTASPLGGRMATYRRLSRKQPPDMCRLRGQLTTQASAVVIVDTSGSMGDRETKERALQVVASGLRKLRSVRVVCADTHIRNSVKLQDVKNFEWEGGGGTDMAHALMEVDRKDRPDSIVLITDAATGWPSRPTRARVIVALTHNCPYYREHIPRWCKTVPLVPEGSS
jgi:predicted metal-dependent peptidase